MKFLFSYSKLVPLVIFSILLSGGISSCKPEKAEKYIGLQLYSLRADMKEDVESTVARVGEIGYDFVEAAGYSDGNFYGMDPVDFKDLVESHGMKFLASHTGRPLPQDEAEWDTTMAWWDTCIAAHKAAGVQYIVQPSLGKNSFDSIVSVKKTAEYFNAVGEKCNAAGIRFGFHNHAKEFAEVEGQVIYDILVENTDPEKVMFQLDIYWIIKGGQDPVEYFEKYPGRFELWHIKDEMEVGASGKIDFRPIFENAELSGMKYYIVEVEKYNFEPIESVRKSFEFLTNADYVK